MRTVRAHNLLPIAPANSQPLLAPWPILSAPAEPIAATNLAAFSALRQAARWDAQAADCEESSQPWSIAHPERFWQSVWSFCGVIGDAGDNGPVPRTGDRMPGAALVSAARLNFAENLLGRRDRGTAIVFGARTA